MGHQRVNPYGGKIVKTFEVMSDSELDAGIFAAGACFESRRSTAFPRRATIVRRAAAIICERVDEFARLATLEMGKLIEEPRGEVLLSIDILNYFAKNAECLMVRKKLAQAIRIESIDAPA